MAPHIRIGLDTAHYSESGGDTAHNTTYYSESGGDTAHEKVSRCSHRGGDTAQNSEFIDRGGTPHKFKVGCTSAAGWVGGRVVYLSNNATLWLHLARWILQDSQLS